MELQTRTCKECGLIFRTPKQEQLCSSCKAKHSKLAHKAQAELQKKPPIKERKITEPKLSIRQVLRIGDIYNRVNGTNLHYGDIVRIIDDAKANRCVCCGAIIPEGTMICPLCESGV